MADFTIPRHVFTGENALTEAVKTMKTLGGKAFIVTGPHVVKSPMMENLKTKLKEVGLEYFVFSDITGEPTDEMIEEGTKCFKDSKADFIIGMGGGSPLDSAKAIAVMSKSNGSISDFLGKDIEGVFPAIVAIPTTAGTGSEATKFTVITDKKTDVKMLLKGESILPRIAVLCPGFTDDMPKGVTAATGLDALTHAIEAYISRKATPLTDVYAVSAVKRIMEYLPTAYKNGYDKKAREEMVLASFEAGVCINNSSVTIVHGMSRPIGALFHVPHGKSNAMLLGKCLSYIMCGALERFAHLGRIIGAALDTEDDETAAKNFICRVEEIIKTCEIPTLKEYGIDEAEFRKQMNKMAEDAILSGSPGNAPVYISKDDCLAIYEQLISL